MLIFDENELLTPAEGILVTIDDFYAVFVQPFATSETRKRLFQEWVEYNRMLRQEIGEGFTQWIDGSFVTHKMNPKDIDIVSFIPSHLFRKFEKRLDYYWTDNWEREGVDAYLVEQLATYHSRYSDYIVQVENWEKLYTRTKASSKSAGISKGFLILDIE
ncbi:DUF6932 family protein [Spirosoma validum]|uniref:Uncharacterized protein n=1 Tax=Spirosoma validum TaxID=2771355 RepID=A0A927AZ76_9BACT|nr:hypothetical protein [Spirosoma validum]MBD2752448.1 hypothetical protein [Spirosoma validum]